MEIIEILSTFHISSLRLISCWILTKIENILKREVFERNKQQEFKEDRQQNKQNNNKNMMLQADVKRKLSLEGKIQAAFGLLRNQFKIQTLTLNFKNQKLDYKHIFFKLFSEKLSQSLDLEYLSLDLELNSIEDIQLLYFSEALEKLQKLSGLKLNLQSNKILDSGVKILSSALSKLKNLEYLHLNLKFNAVTSESLNYLGAALESLPNFQDLTLFILDGNHIESGINSQFADSLSQLSLLQSLNLKIAGEQLSIPDTDRINNAFSKINGLSNLTLFFQGEFKDKALENITEGISKLSKLESFTLTWIYQELNSQTMKNLSNSFSSLINLRQLTIVLQKNNINEQGFEYLFSGISKLKLLTFLNLKINYNLISEKRILDLSYSISQLHNLTNFQLSLQFSSITLNGAVSITTCIQKLANLTNLSLDLEGNKFYDMALIDMTESLIKNTQLKSLKLNISQCDLSEKGFKDILMNISKLSTLKSLTLRVHDISKNIESTKASDLCSCLQKLLDLAFIKIAFSLDSRQPWLNEQKSLKKLFLKNMPRLVVALKY